MSRLTKRLGDQVIIRDIGVTDCKKVCDSMYEYDNPCDMCIIDEVFRKLAHYEDLEEQGRLIELPCAIGDPVWRIVTQQNNYDDSPYKIVMQSSFRLDFLPAMGDRIFATKEEAEAKLNALKGE